MLSAWGALADVHYRACAWPGVRGQRYVFNGDFVDRGEQGCELLLTLLALKVRIAGWFLKPNSFWPPNTQCACQIYCPKIRGGGCRLSIQIMCFWFGCGTFPVPLWSVSSLQGNHEDLTTCELLVLATILAFYIHTYDYCCSFCLWIQRRNYPQIFDLLVQCFHQRVQGGSISLAWLPELQYCCFFKFHKNWAQSAGAAFVCTSRRCGRYFHCPCWITAVGLLLGGC